jgi:hypothetical protein
LATAIGIIVGGAITWLVAWIYYKKAGDQLLAESRKLKLTTDLVLYKLQYPDTPTQIKRDEHGDVVGLIAEMSTKRPDTASGA